MAISYTVQPGDSMWKIANTYKVGLSELIQANPQIENVSSINPNQVITIPEFESQTADLADQVIQLANDERAKQGSKALETNWELSRVARMKSEDMANNNILSNESPIYGSPANMVSSFNIPYTAVGENIARGQVTPQAVMDSWMNSPRHRDNILNSEFNQIGVGCHNSGSTYWTMLLIRH